ncbi:MAG: plasmid mobilization relaxosome protein MobC [Sulfitobacter sp.]
MKPDVQQNEVSAAASFRKATSDAVGSKPRPSSPLTLRLTAEERTRLEELAAGMTLSAYIRACMFGADAVKRKKRPKNVVEDKKAAAEALALLGQSRIASNLNQLAYHANIGMLEMGDQERADIAEANAHLLAIRTLLISALGKSR